MGRAARSSGSHIESRLKMEPHGVFKEVTTPCTNEIIISQSSCRKIGTSARRAKQEMRGIGKCKHKRGFADMRA